MVDNVDFTPGSGATGATDDVGGVHYPRVKVSVGADGAANDLNVGAGNVATGTPRVTLAADDPGVVAMEAVLEGVTGLHQADVAALTLFNDNTGTDSSATPVTITRTGTWRARASGATIPSIQLTRQNHDADAYDDMHGYVLDTDYREWEFNAREGDSIGAVCTGSSVTLDLTLEYLGPNASGVQSINLSTLEASGAATQAAVQLIDDAIFADDAAFTLAASKVTMSGAIRDDALTTLTAVDGDAVPLRVNSTGALWVGGTVDLGATDNAVLDSLASLLGTIDADTSALAGAISGSEVQVDVVAALPAGTNNIGDVDVASIAAGETHIGQVSGAIVRAQTTITRPADTSAYGANDALADSTSAPTSGGFTFSNVARASGGGGFLSDLEIISSVNASALTGRIWIFDSAVTAINDNAAFSISLADQRKAVAVVPFNLAGGVSGGNGKRLQITNINKGYVCSGSANLRFLIEVTAAYTPASAEQITVTAVTQPID